MWKQILGSVRKLKRSWIGLCLWPLVVRKLLFLPLLFSIIAVPAGKHSGPGLGSGPLSIWGLQGHLLPHLSPLFVHQHISSCFPIKHIAKVSLFFLLCLVEGKDSCLLYFPTAPDTLLSNNECLGPTFGQLLLFLILGSKGTTAFSVHWCLPFGYLVWYFFLKAFPFLNLMKTFPSVISICCWHFIIIHYIWASVGTYHDFYIKVTWHISVTFLYLSTFWYPHILI